MLCSAHKRDHHLNWGSGMISIVNASLKPESTPNRTVNVTSEYKSPLERYDGARRVDTPGPKCLEFHQNLRLNRDLAEIRPVTYQLCSTRERDSAPIKYLLSWPYILSWRLLKTFREKPYLFGKFLDDESQMEFTILMDTFGTNRSV